MAIIVTTIKLNDLVLVDVIDPEEVIIDAEGTYPKGIPICSFRVAMGICEAYLTQKYGEESYKSITHFSMNIHQSSMITPPTKGTSK